MVFGRYAYAILRGYDLGIHLSGLHWWFIWADVTAHALNKSLVFSLPLKIKHLRGNEKSDFFAIVSSLGLPSATCDPSGSADLLSIARITCIQKRAGNIVFLGYMQEPKSKVRLHFLQLATKSPRDDACSSRPFHAKSPPGSQAIRIRECHFLMVTLQVFFSFLRTNASS